MSTKRYSLTNGCPNRDGLIDTQPRGAARPWRKRWMGTSKAATVPPAPKSAHQKGSIILFVGTVQLRSKRTNTSDGLRWYPVFPPTYDHDLGGRLKPGDTMVQREQECHDMENDPSRGAQLLHKSAVRCRTAQQLRDLDEKHHQEDSDEHARQFTHHKEEVLR